MHHAVQGVTELSHPVRNCDQNLTIAEFEITVFEILRPTMRIH